MANEKLHQSRHNGIQNPFCSALASLNHLPGAKKIAESYRKKGIRAILSISLPRKKFVSHLLPSQTDWNRHLFVSEVLLWPMAKRITFYKFCADSKDAWYSATKLENPTGNCSIHLLEQLVHFSRGSLFSRSRACWDKNQQQPLQHSTAMLCCHGDCKGQKVSQGAHEILGLRSVHHPCKQLIGSFWHGGIKSLKPSRSG